MKRNSYMTIALIAIVVFLTAFVGCDNRVFKADSFEIVSLTAPEELFSGVEGEVKALVVEKDTGVPAPSQVVTFKTDRGVIQAKGTTNEFGVATVKFSHTWREENMVTATIEASIHKSVKTVGIGILKHPGNWVIENLTANPTSIQSDNGKTYSLVKALVIGPDGVAAMGETVRFKTRNADNTRPLGRITSIAVTDSTGIATARFSDNWDLGVATITAMIDQSERSINIEIKPTEEEYALSMTAEPRVIYSDNNITSATIRVRVRDKSGFPVAGTMVRFRASIGQIASQVLTDEMGIATTKFYDGGELGEAIIDAFADDISASVTVTIEETPAIDRIEMTSIPNILSLEQVQTLHARAMDVNDEPVADGTIITFSASKGFFEENDIDGGNNFGYTVNGWASVIWNTGTSAGPVTITARVGMVIGEVNSEIAPGPPAYVYLTPETRVAGVWGQLPAAGLPVNYTNDVRIRADVKDLYNNAVRAGIPLLFDTELGAIIGVASTDNLGVAYARFFPGVVAGTAMITATTRPPDEIVGVTVIHIYSEDVQSIAFATQEEVFLDVRGTGGVETRTLTSHLKDFNGNLVSGQHWVRYEITRGPAGVNLNNAGLTVDVMADNGEAHASVNSGTHSGTVTVRISLIDNPEIRATKSNIVIRSGVPDSIQPFISGFDQGTAMGGGLWKAQAGAVVRDEYGNEVINGTVVHFSLGTMPPPPRDTNIQGAGYVGNASDENEDGDPGVAYTYVFYHGLYTNKQIRIIAETGDVSGERTVTLPIQQPRLEVATNPGAVRFFAAGPATNPVFRDVEIIATLSDGQGNLIADSKILLISTHGDIRYHPQAVPFPPAPPEPEYMYTLDGTGAFGERGKAYGIIRGFGWECPPPVDEYFTMIDVQVTVVLQGTDTIAQTSFTMIRYIIAQPTR